MRNETKKILEELDFCTAFMHEVARKHDEALAGNHITEEEANHHLKWFWYWTFQRLMDDAFRREMPEPDWREKVKGV